MTEELQLKGMTTGNAADGLRLSRLANWNQTLQDWELLLSAGSGMGFHTDAGLWVASMVALPLGPRHGWISMVLTDPDWRRRGLAKRLMARGMEILEARELIPTLDATPAGETVYRKIGFAGDTALARWKVTPSGDRSSVVAENGLNLRPVDDADLEALAAWDREHSGCDRTAILRFLRATRPDLATLAEREDGTLAGFIMGRSGDRLPQLGPLVADDSRVAGLLMKVAAAATAGPLYVDAFDRTQPLLAAEFNGSWTRERGFTRLLKADSPSPENPKTVYLAAGPELS
jgi:GNAT superfamily N-acetyltransferase